MRSNFWNMLVKVGERWLLPVLLLATILGCIDTLLKIIALPGDLSANRLALLSIPAVFGMGQLYLLFFVIRNPSRFQKIISRIQSNDRLLNRINILLPVIWFVLVIIAFLSIASLGRWGAVYERLSPILQLAFLFVTEIWIFWLFQTRKSAPFSKENVKGPLLAGLFLIFGIALIWLIIGMTGKGIGIGTQYWGKSGVPILHWQVGISWVIMLIWIGLDRHNTGERQTWKKDVFIVFALWITAFLVWQSIPTTPNRFNVEAYPPNFTNYPYSDAGDYALEAEAIRIGNGFPFGFIDKPLHLTFLAVLSWLAGSDYSRMIQIQTGFLALIPGLIYVIASKTHSRPAGILAGLMILFMQVNNLSIAGSIQATNVKMAMSESLTAMMLMIFTLALLAWWKNPDKSHGYPALAGALLGLSCLVRLNALVILPFVLAAWLLSFGLKKKKTWLAALIFLIFCILPLVPWGIRNQIVLDDPLRSYSSKAIGVILRKRIYPIINLFPTSVKDQEQNILPVETEPTENDPEPETSGGWEMLMDSFVHTGLHNLVTVSLSLPASASHSGLDETIRQPYWDQEWDGTFTHGGQFVLAGSLILAALGFSFGWKRNRLASLVLFVILLPYLLANTLSLVSGGRYIIPVDWVLPVYYSIGIAGVSFWLFDLNRHVETNYAVNDSQTSIPPDFSRLIWIGIGLVLAISCIPTFLSLFIPKYFNPMDNAAVLNEIKTMKLELPEYMTWQKLEEFAADKDASFKIGKAMFPRWMKSGEADTGGAGSAFSALPFDHLSFSYLSDEMYPSDAVLPINEPVEYLPNASDVIMVGCRTKAYFDAVLVIVKGPEPVVYERPDIKSLTCPLPTP